MASALAAGIAASYGFKVWLGTGDGASHYFPLVRLPEFILGIFLATLVKGGSIRQLPLPAAGAFTLLLAAACWPLAETEIPTQTYIMLPAYAALIVAGAQRDIEGSSNAFLTHRWSIYLGELSFCFYLVHLLVITAALQYWNWNHDWTLAGGLAPAAGLLLIALIFAAVLHHMVEKPCNHALLQSGWVSRLARVRRLRESPSDPG